MAQRDSAVSDYRPCAEEPPAQSASLWGRNSTQDSGGTRAKEESVLREEFFPFLFFFFFFTELGFLTGTTEDLSSSAHLCFIFFLSSPPRVTLLTGTTHAASPPLLDDRVLGTSPGKTPHILLLFFLYYCFYSGCSAAPFVAQKCLGRFSTRVQFCRLLEISFCLYPPFSCSTVIVFISLLNFNEVCR